MGSVYKIKKVPTNTPSPYNPIANRASINGTHEKKNTMDTLLTSITRFTVIESGAK